jgi:coatomer protein complex subunit gamma
LLHFYISLSGLQVSVVGLERALNAYVKEAPDTPFDIKTVPLATASMQEQMAKPGKPSMGREELLQRCFLVKPYHML